MRVVPFFSITDFTYIKFTLDGIMYFSNRNLTYFYVLPHVDALQSVIQKLRLAYKMQ